MATLGLIGLLIIFGMALYLNKRKAQRACEILSNAIRAKNAEFQDIASKMIISKTYNPNSIITPGSDVYLIEKTETETGIKMYALNNNKNQTILEIQYNRLIDRMNKSGGFTYSFSLESFSVYYGFPKPYTGYILKIDYPQKLFT